MKKSILITSVVLASFAAQVKAQFIVADPAHIATSIVNSINQIVETSTTATNMINNFKEVQKVYNQGKEYYDKLKAVHDLVKDAKKVRECILMVGEIGDIYVNSFQRMLSDPNFRYDELAAIANGYSMLLQGSADMLLELKGVVNANGLSMTDHERMDIINYVHDRLKNQRNLVGYYTRKNISVSYLRAKKTGETERVVALYGNANDRYW
ncbi:transposase [Synergistales bacterium]|nr:transposase [Synergistales bacterium]